MQLTPNDTLIIVDPQNDFCPGGALAVPGGDEIMPTINKLIDRFLGVGGSIVLTQDWHPRAHSSFASSHAFRSDRPWSAFDVMRMSYGEQTLWPDHCVQGTKGAEFHPRLNAKAAQVVIRKGYNPAVDSYSAFYENDRKTSTGLRGWLKERQTYRCFFVGLALDFCVGYSALDARATSFDTYVIEDATRAIDLNGSLAAMQADFQRRGVHVVYSESVQDF